ncbi:17171_t:CDS:1 [Cetraspora pellucida]|uniref:17171_t:CDS:1 n=1 Tax=Cetraspora pellucida TaxID=1433469 RepID=A0ACA9P0T0_9GLOM|nr:17171_t:CDS:1 [Cetraspora pellucida]
MSSRNRNIKKKARAISKKVRHNWSVREKLMVVYYFERIKNVRATARRFDIEPKQVRNWRSKKQELLNAAPYLLTLNPGRPALYPLLERRLVEWVDVLRRKQAAVTQNMVIRRAKNWLKLMR